MYRYPSFFLYTFFLCIQLRRVYLSLQLIKLSGISMIIKVGQSTGIPLFYFLGILFLLPTILSINGSGLIFMCIVIDSCSFVWSMKPNHLGVMTYDFSGVEFPEEKGGPYDF